MRALISAIVAAAFLTTPAVARPRLDSEAKLARELEGRVAGEPVKCVPLHAIRSSRIIDRTAIVYDAGRTIYVNRPRSGRESLDQWDVLVTRPFNSQLCSIDTVHLVDPTSHMLSGIVFLGDFVPYRKER